jgi:hypothetical protein
MKRREFIALIGCAATAWPFAAHAQQRDGMRRPGVLMGNHSKDPVGQALATALVQGLGALDWHGGDNLRIEWRWAGGDPALFQRYAAELVALSPDAILAQTSPAVVALRLCENSEVGLACRTFVSNELNKKRIALSGAVKKSKERKQFCAFSARQRFHTGWTHRGHSTAYVTICRKPQQIDQRPQPSPLGDACRVPRN